MTYTEGFSDSYMQVDTHAHIRMCVCVCVCVCVCLCGALVQILSFERAKKLTSRCNYQEIHAR
jgi:hypothetical protein